MKNTLKYLLALGLGMALLYWVFKDIDLNTTLQSFKDANYFLVFMAFLTMLFAHISRAYRWKIMMEPMGYFPSIKNTTWAVLIGYFTNLLLPRAGELARSASLQKSENIPFEKSFGAVIAERVIDVVVALLLVLLNVLFEFNRIQNLVNEMFGNTFSNKGIILLLALLGISLLFSLFFFIKKNKERLLQNSLAKKILDIFKGLWSGFSSVFKIKKTYQFFFHTFLIWTLYYVGTYILCLSVPIGQLLSPLAIFTILVMGSMGMAAPTIGGIGAYHFLVGKIVTLYGLNAQEGINLATFLHTMQGILFVGILGLIAFVFSFKKSK